MFFRFLLLLYGLSELEHYFSGCVLDALRKFLPILIQIIFLQDLFSTGICFKFWSVFFYLRLFLGYFHSGFTIRHLTVYFFYKLCISV